MIAHRAFKYRVYPTPSQEAKLRRWEHALRFLWNLALEQRRMGLSRTDKVYVSVFEQKRQLTELRKSTAWLAEVPRDVCDAVLIDLDKGWQLCFSGVAAQPKWKKRGMNIGFREHRSDCFGLGEDWVSFAKIGRMRAEIHREHGGKPKSCTIKRDGDQWFAIILCEIEQPDPTRRVDPVVAIDRGITNLLADSDGKLTPGPRLLEKSLKKLARAQRVVSRRKKGSKNREKAKLRVMRLHRKVRRQREHLLHNLSTTYAKNQGTVVVEKLNVQGMVRSNLGRSIHDAGWSSFISMLRYKLDWSGGTLVEVPAAYSSQTCSACGYVDAKSRDRERFCCTSCGHVDHADINAAKVLKSRASRSVLPVDGSLPEGPGRSRKAKVTLRAVRRKPTQSHRA